MGSMEMYERARVDIRDLNVVGLSGLGPCEDVDKKWGTDYLLVNQNVKKIKPSFFSLFLVALFIHLEIYVLFWKPARPIQINSVEKLSHCNKFHS